MRRYQTRAMPLSFYRLVCRYWRASNWFRGTGRECLFTSEWNSFSQETYRANFKDSATHVMAGDIRSVREKDVPEHDLLLAGFPCQPFSIAGVSKKNALDKRMDLGVRSKERSFLISLGYWHITNLRLFSLKT